MYQALEKRHRDNYYEEKSMAKQCLEYSDMLKECAAMPTPSEKLSGLVLKKGEITLELAKLHRQLADNERDIADEYQRMETEHAGQP